MPPPERSCDTHPTVIAGWHCEACARALCGACTAQGLQGLPVCTGCGLPAQAILVPRAVVSPFSRTWASALRHVVTLPGLAQILVMTAAVQLLLGVGPSAWLLGRALEVGWVLYLARRAGVGFAPFGLPRYSDLFSVWLGPLPRLLAGAGVVLAAASWLYGFGARAVSVASLWPWLLAVLAVLLVPPSLVVASVEGDGRQAPWPWRLPRWLSTLGADLRPLQVAVLLAALMEVVTGSQAPFSAEDTRLDLHILQAFVPHWLSMHAIAALGCLAGALVWTRATELGHGNPAEDLVPRLSEAPTGRWVPPAPDPEVVAAEQARRFAPIELEDPAAAIAAAVERSDADDALSRIDGGEVLPDALAADVVIGLAQLLAGRGEVVRAAQLLRGLVHRPADAHTPRALVILGRLCVERLGATGEGHALYQRVLRDFPDTPAAAFVRERLRPGPT